MRQLRDTLARVLVVAVALAVTLPAPGAEAQNYRFAVPQMRMVSQIHPDASVEIAYEIVFENRAGYSAIDIVDIGLPHEDYDRANMTASIDGHALTDIRPSEYIDIGVEVHLGGYAVPGGRRGTFQFTATLPDLVFSDTTNEALASFRITPTWFDAGLVEGVSDLEIGVVLPPGVTPEQVLHQGDEFSSKQSVDDRTLVTWAVRGTRLTDAHLRGLSFPLSAMSRVVEISRWDLLEGWWAANTPLRFVLGAGVLVLFGFGFFRFTARTGCVVFVPLVGLLVYLFVTAPSFQLYATPLLIGLVGLLYWAVRRKQRTYLPPLANVEGGGIKRGLTAPEAAVLLELPLGRVLSLVLFGMLKKGLAEQVSADPLKLEPAAGFGNNQHGLRRKAAAERGVVVHDYEHAFLDVISHGLGEPVESLDFAAAMQRLIAHVAERVSAFDIDETRAYYRHIVRRAWIEAKALATVEPPTRAVDKNLEWLLIDDDCADRFEQWESGGYSYYPIWLRHAGTTPAASSSSYLDGSASVTGGRSASSAPAFGDVAASFAGFFENTTGTLASQLTGVRVGGGSAGVVNLGGFDKAASSFLKAMGEGGGGGGGGGGGSSCACAGCACACACAGGGR